MYKYAIVVVKFRFSSILTPATDNVEFYVIEYIDRYRLQEIIRCLQFNGRLPQLEKLILQGFIQPVRVILPIISTYVF